MSEPMDMSSPPSGDVGEWPMMSLDDQDRLGMSLAIDQALNAQLAGEVPVGAVVLRRDGEGVQVVATGYNRPITTHDPTAHAEIIALRQAAQMLGNYRLPEVELYVTLEPCAMCAMALMHARVKRVVFGASDPKTGAAGSVLNLFENKSLNHHTQWVGGVDAQRCGALLRNFFAERRAQQRAALGDIHPTVAAEKTPSQDPMWRDDGAGAPLPVPLVIENETER